MTHICRDSLYWTKLTVLPSAIGCNMRKSLERIRLIYLQGFTTQTKQEAQVIKFNKKFPDSVNMTLELYRQGFGFVPNAQELKSLFYFDTSYRDMICRQWLHRLVINCYNFFPVHQMLMSQCNLCPGCSTSASLLKLPNASIKVKTFCTLNALEESRRTYLTKFW